MADKYGSYIQKLMSVILDEEQEQFVKKMSWEELNKIKNDLSEFLDKRKLKEPHEKQENPNQQLLFD